MTACHSTVGTELVTPEDDPNTDAMAQQLQNLFKLINFYYHMDFSPEQRLTVTKAIIEQIDHHGVRTSLS